MWFDLEEDEAPLPQIIVCTSNFIYILRIPTQRRNFRFFFLYVKYQADHFDTSPGHIKNKNRCTTYL